MGREQASSPRFRPSTSSRIALLSSGVLAGIIDASDTVRDGNCCIASFEGFVKRLKAVFVPKVANKVPCSRFTDSCITNGAYYDNLTAKLGYFKQTTRIENKLLRCRVVAEKLLSLLRFGNCCERTLQGTSGPERLKSSSHKTHLDSSEVS
ncbi:hypothetical protein OS493_034923 [Desmophyllum pertusum]|uniref:Uncharacterized protein n=1 Tax=Desmophyllum pertusum TaxID=174260 RepID=A0A9W9Z7P0_9CNID|nr:hypothetical protein OS493_034923 [Desmophyllum pertusum]